jgi:hypothetical protein
MTIFGPFSDTSVNFFFPLLCHDLPIVVARCTGVLLSVRLFCHWSSGEIGDERHLDALWPAI